MITAALLVLMSSPLIEVSRAAAQDVPMDTIVLTGGSVAAGIGYTWSNGTLIFDGKKYPVRVNGISILHVGLSDYTAS